MNPESQRELPVLNFQITMYLYAFQRVFLWHKNKTLVTLE